MMRIHLVRTCLSPALPTRRAFSSTARTLESDVVKLAFDRHDPQTVGPGSPLLFLHGLFGSKTNFRSISKALARDLKRSVYAVDMRNHGASPHTKQHDYASMGRDVEAFIHEHDLGQVTLIGHSMGAKAAMTVALHSPDLVDRLISVDNAPIDAALSSDFGKYVHGMEEIAREKVKKQSEADKILSKLEPSVPIRQFLLSNLVKSPETGTYEFRIPVSTLKKSLGLVADFPYKNPEETRFEKPSLFIRGTKSKYVADEALPIIGRFFPLFRVVDVDAGHWVISENPEAFRKAVVEFLSDPEGESE